MRALSDIVRALGAEPRAIRRISHRENTHWKVLTKDGRALILRRFGEKPDLDADVAWESKALAAMDDARLPVAAPLGGPARFDGRLFALYPHLSGRPLTSQARITGLQRAAGMQRFYRGLGGALADYHVGAAKAPLPRQRAGWCEMAHGARPLQDDRERLLRRLETVAPEGARALRGAAEALEARNLPAVFAGAPRLIVHGDFSPWNILVRKGAVSGLLDFELAHVDVAAADVAFARRGSHDAAVWGYLEKAKLPPEHLAALDGLWTGIVLFGAWKALERWPEGEPYDPAALDWNLQQLSKTRPYRGPG
jgi:Ser/Thr protein kinase RdoA (MazF antagonist)